ncbi:hypothetical protein GCM10011297_30620 [Bacterioplanes sanyensis]|uniref:PDR/VanB family oxidoreductase n=1 Tax=Bacterioplanes sanyensis TaxID=1249553 RepID=UPI00167834F4|nr:PDR/VanB family oxidoreductase [Bacterioplanes sanyensis]GGY55713.1 hypothetical protein GCM10011297_30620 [Bacterioplanes sanyensis]
MSTRLNLTLQRSQALTERIYELEWASSDGRPLPQAQAGAHLEFYLPNGLVRHYSLLDDGHNGVYRIGVLRDPQSRGGSDWLTRQPAGTQLEASAPRNHFALDDSPGKQRVLLGAGIGITPIVAMVRALVARGERPQLHYLVRTADDAAYADELSQWLPETHWQLHLSEPHGAVDPASLIDTVTADTQVYACGPQGFLDRLEQAAQQWPAGVLRLERFRGDSDADSRTTQACEVVLQRSGKTLLLAPGESLMAALQDAGVAPPTLCGEGACGTCAVGIIAGEAEHADVLQSDAEKQCHDTLYPCVSAPKGQRLVLDL